MRPTELERPEVVIAPPAPVVLDNVKVLSVSASPGGEKCAYPSCQNIARDGSKYCSRACSNRNARKRHKERKVA